MLPDILRDNLTVVFCGTAVGDHSAQRSAYYAGPGNKFWRILHQVGLTPRLLHPEEYPSLPQYGIGLTDLVKRRSGSDAALVSSDFDVRAFETRIRRHVPKILCFNGKRAAQEYLAIKEVEYGPMDRLLGATKLFVAPSTSGAASGYWAESHWTSLGQLCRS